MEVLVSSLRVVTEYAVRAARSQTRSIQRGLHGGKEVKATFATTAHEGTRVALADHLRADNGFNHYLMKAQVFSHPSLKTGHAVLDFSKVARSERHKYKNSAGAMHGGALATLHDFAACQLLSGQGYQGATSSMAVNYFGPVNLLDMRVKEVTAVAHLLHITKRHAMVRSELLVDGELVGDATLRFAINLKNMDPGQLNPNDYDANGFDSLDHPGHDLPEQPPEHQTVS